MDIPAMLTTTSKSSWKIYSTTELKKRYKKLNKELQAKTHGADRLIIQHSLPVIALLHLYFRTYAPDLVKTKTKFQTRWKIYTLSIGQELVTVPGLRLSRPYITMEAVARETTLTVTHQVRFETNCNLQNRSLQKSLRTSSTTLATAHSIFSEVI